MSKLWAWYLPGYIMALPLTLFGLLLALYYRPERYALNQGCIEFVLPEGRYLIGGDWVGGQTFGNVIFYRDARCYSWEEMRVHERCHTVQAMVGGIIFALAYVANYAINRLCGLSNYEAYKTIWFENQAYYKQSNPNGWGAW